MPLPTLVVLVLVSQSPTVSSDPTAYLDPLAGALVQRARARRETVDRTIRGYDALMRERIGVGIRALRRDRMLYRRELALRIAWRRDTTGRIDVLGARQAVPAVRSQVSLPEDLEGDAPDYAFDPADDRLMIGLEDSSWVRHPLAAESEADYRYQTGDSATLTFPDGRVIQLRELRVIPRRLEFRLMSGSLWIDTKSYAVVRLLFRPARPFDFDLDVHSTAGGSGGSDGSGGRRGRRGRPDIPGFLKPLRADVRYVTIEYGLWEQRWWLPRLLAFDAVASAGSFLHMPLRYERLYTDYAVQADSAPRLAPRTRPATTGRTGDDSVEARCHRRVPVHCRCEGGACLAFEVRLAADTAALLASPELLPAFAGIGDTVVSEGELRELGRKIGALPQAPWQLQARPPRWGLGRYNRIEGLALGAHGGLDLGRLELDARGWIATSDGQPDVRVGLLRETAVTSYRLAGYRRLAAVDPAARSLGLGNSLAGLLLGRDDGEYFRAAGLELTGAPALAERPWYAWRIFVERETTARKRTDFSVPHVLDADRGFRPNIIADSAEQLGAALALRSARGADPSAPRWGAEVTIDGGVGTFDFLRAAVTTRVTTPVARGFAGALELAGGMSLGTVPAQSLWYLGGAATLRGYAGGAARGDAFWRARAEVANALPGARLVLFSDLGRAGPRDALSAARPLVSAGLGGSFFDGLVRIDLARALRPPVGWRLEFYVDGIL